MRRTVIPRRSTWTCKSGNSAPQMWSYDTSSGTCAGRLSMHAGQCWTGQCTGCCTALAATPLCAPQMHCATERCLYAKQPCPASCTTHSSLAWQQTDNESGLACCGDCTLRNRDRVVAAGAQGRAHPLQQARSKARSVSNRACAALVHGSGGVMTYTALAWQHLTLVDASFDA